VPVRKSLFVHDNYTVKTILFLLFKKGACTPYRHVGLPSQKTMTLTVA